MVYMLLVAYDGVVDDDDEHVVIDDQYVVDISDNIITCTSQ